jgi:3-phosphoshikimate 1-carboxyvinyltransferase
VSDFIDLGPFRRAAGRVRLPGSKSISNRVLLLAALAEGETRTAGLLDSDDTRRMLEALTALGVRWSRAGGGDDVVVEGTGGRFPVRSASLFLGNAGTAFRPLTAVLALSGGDYELSGVPRMHERPIGDLVDALRQLGARIDYLGTPGYPPLRIRAAAGGGADRVRVRGDVSSQFLTGLLIGLPLASRGIVIDVEGELVSKPYVEITLNLLARFGVTVEREGWESFRVPAAARFASPGEVVVEGDASAASYFLAAGAIAGGPVRVDGAGRQSIQGDVRFADVLERMGARVEWGSDWIAAAGGEGLRGVDVDLNHIPDAAMTVAVAALYARGPTTLRNIGSWRVKETDRIHAMATELAKVGAEVEEGADWLRIAPPRSLRPAAIDTYDDHRMAMCFSLASFGGVTVRINDPGCVAKTFPDYFREFGRLVAP